MPKKFKQKPLEVVSEQWNGENLREVAEVIGDANATYLVNPADKRLFVRSGGVTFDIPLNFWIVANGGEENCGGRGCFLRSPETFDANYEAVGAEERELLGSISPDEKEEIIDGAFGKLRSAPPVVIQLEPVYAVGLVGQLQLAFRHPQNVGPSRKILEQATRTIIDQMDPDKGDLYKVLMMGFDSRFDS
jgi:hypothetical protein